MMTTLDKYSYFFNRVNELHHKYGHAKRPEFNVFSILRREHDEVNLHSRFIFELLNPHGSHKKGEIFLNKFLQQLHIDGFSTKGIRVQREYKNIDILITNRNSQAILVENKVYALDGDAQLERYYDVLKKEGYDNVNIIYLSLFGNEPSSTSLGKLDSKMIDLASYEKTIISWLESCEDECKQESWLNEIILQYKCLIKKLTGNDMPEQYSKNLKDLLLQGGNIELAFHISKVLDDALTETQLLFWETLESKLINLGYKIFKDIQSYHKEYIANSYSFKKTRGITNFYGILISLGKLNSKDMLAFYIEKTDASLMYGFTVCRESGRDTFHLESQYDEICKQIAKVGDFERNEWFLGYKWLDAEINFNKVSSFMVALTDNEKLENETEKLAKDVDMVIKHFEVERNT